MREIQKTKIFQNYPKETANLALKVALVLLFTDIPKKHEEKCTLFINPLTRNV